MEKVILLLIEDDIKFERQHWMLEKIGWDSETILTHNLTVITSLLNIELTDDVIEVYSKMLERSLKLDFEKEQIKELSSDIYVFLNGLNKD